MSGSELGTGYITITASAAGLGQSIVDIFNQTDAAAQVAGTSAGNAYSAAAAAAAAGTSDVLATQFTDSAQAATVAGSTAGQSFSDSVATGAAGLGGALGSQFSGVAAAADAEGAAAGTAFGDAAGAGAETLSSAIDATFAAAHASAAAEGAAAGTEFSDSAFTGTADLPSAILTNFEAAAAGAGDAGSSAGADFSAGADAGVAELAGLLSSQFDDAAGAAGDAGGAAGDAFGSAAGESGGTGVSSGLSEAFVGAGAGAGAAGAEAGAEFADNAKEKVLDFAKEAATAFGAIAVGSFFEEAIKGAEELQAQQRLTAQVIKTTGSAAGITATEAGHLAEELSNVSGNSDVASQNLVNILLTFTNIKNVGANKIFDETAASVQDLAAVMGTDATSAARQLGRALNDPSVGLSALTRLGITFSAQQKEQIKTLQKSGDLLGAQGIILASVQMKFGGAAEALKTPTKAIALEFERLQEQLGEKLLPAFTSVLHVMGDDVLPILGSVAAVVVPVVDAVGTLANGFSKLPGPIKDAAFALVALKVLGGPVSGIFSALSLPIRNFANDVGNIKAASAEAGGSISTLGATAERSSAGLKSLGKAIGAGGLFALGSVIIGDFSSAISHAKAVQDDLTGTVKSLSDSLVDQNGKWDSVSKAALIASVTGSSNFQSLLDHGAKYGDVLDLVTGKTKNAGTVLSELNFKGASPDDLKGMLAYVGGLTDIIPKAQTSAAAISAYNAAQKDAAASTSGADKANLSYTQSIPVSALEQLHGVLDDTAIGMTSLGGATEDSSHKWTVFGQSAGDGALQASKSLDGVTLAAMGIPDAINNAAKAFDLSAAKTSVDALSASMTAATAETSAFSIAIDQLTGTNIPLEDATANLNAQVLALAATFGDAAAKSKVNTAELVSSKGAIDTTTDSGQKLYASVQNYSKAYDTSVTAAEDAAGAHATVTEKVNAAKAAADSAYKSFITQATGLGLSDTQAVALADHMGILEGKKLTPKTLNLTAEDAATGVIKSIEAQQIPDKSFAVTVDTSQAVAQFQALTGAANAAIGAASQAASAAGTPQGRTLVSQARAGGGQVFGAGTGTSDSIPAFLSNTEGVNTAAAMSHPENVRAMNFMNSGGVIKGYKNGGIVGYATGGLVTPGQLAGDASPSYTPRLGLIVSALSGIAGELVTARDAIGATASAAHAASVALVAARQSAQQANQSAAQRVASAQAAALAADRAAQKLGAAAQANVEKAEAVKVAAALKAAAVTKVQGDAQVAAALKANQLANASSIASSRNYSDAQSAQKALQGSYRTLQELGAKYDTLTANLATAQSNLAQDKSNRASAAAGYASNLAGFGGGITGYQATRDTSGTIIAGLKYDAAQQTAFGNQIADLKRKGLSADLLSQIVSKGVDGGGITANALDKGSAADIRTVNALQKQIEATAAKTADATAGAQYDPIIKAQAAQVNSLAGMVKTTNAQVEKLAATIDAKLIAALEGWTVDVNAGKLIAPHMKQLAHTISTKAQQR